MAYSPTPLERRRRQRAQVHWSVKFVCPESVGLLESMTENVSSDGFYCLLEQPLQPGERLPCTLLLPPLSPGRPEGLTLQCQTAVVHVERSGARFGVGFRIEHYSVLRSSGETLDAAESLGLREF